MEVQQTVQPNMEEMTPLFINRVTYTEAVYTELNRMGRPMWSRILAILADLLLIVSLILELYSRDYGTVLPFGIMLLGLLYLQIRLPCHVARREFKQSQVIYHGPMQFTLSFFDAYILTRNDLSGGTVTMDYGHISRMLRGKTLYLLKCPQNTYVVLDRNGFTEGTAAEFERFIEEKKIPAKGTRRKNGTH